MTQAEFVGSLGRELSVRGLVFDLRELTAFIQGTWPLVEEDPCPDRWAGEFVDTCHVRQEHHLEETSPTEEAEADLVARWMSGRSLTCQDCFEPIHQAK